MNFREAAISTIREILQTAVISLFIFLFVYLILVQPHRVKGDSMLPNFYDGELLLTEKVSYRFDKPQRGDVIVFAAPYPRKVDFIKRVIGLPGDTVEIVEGSIFINGKKLRETYETQSTQGNINIKLGEDQYYVLGDNRNSSSDSRSFGAINKKAIKGRAWLVYWPIVKSQKSAGFRVISRVNYRVPDTFYDR